MMVYVIGLFDMVLEKVVGKGFGLWNFDFGLQVNY